MLSSMTNSIRKKRAGFIAKLASTQSWTIHYNQPRWWDGVPLRHGQGTNFSFADGHAEYWKWQDSRTLKVARQEENWQDYVDSPGNSDLRRVQKASWGELGYTYDTSSP